MAIVVDNSTRLVVQGITGREGTFHALRNKAYGTNVVAGVTPGKGGESVDGIPVFDTVRDAVEEAQPNTANRATASPLRPRRQWPSPGHTIDQTAAVCGSTWGRSSGSSNRRPNWVPQAEHRSASIVFRVSQAGQIHVVRPSWTSIPRPAAARTASVAEATSFSEDSVEGPSGA